MKKILFTDLCGTLISRNLSEAKKYYGSQEKELSIISRYINEFLSEDNELVIVTSPGGHGYFGSIFNDRLAKLDAYIRNELDSHVAYYLQGNGKINPDDNITKKVLNGKVYYSGKHPFEGIGIDKKEEAIDDFLQNVKPPYQIYGIGDTEQDIPMLLRIEELGGISSIIDTTLYHRPTTTDEIIKNELDLEFDFDLYNMIKNKKLIDPNSGTYTEEARALLEKKERRKYELYTSLYKGELDLDELNKNYSKYIELSNYRTAQDSSFSRNNQFYENYPLSEDIVQSVMNMPCYSSFGEYYTKVLKIK